MAIGMHPLCVLAVLVLGTACALMEGDDPPPLPNLPDQYYLRIEANLKGRDTIYLTEFYDGPGNRGAAMIFRNNQTLWVTYDYADLQRVFITWGDDGQPNCTVANLTESGFNIIPFHLKDGMPVVASSSELFMFGQEFNETYIGEDVVRGIPVEHWLRTIPHPGGSMVDLNYYFTVPGYHTATNGSQVPVRATLNGTAPNSPFGPDPNGTHLVNHVYEFFDVHIEPPHGYWSRAFTFTWRKRAPNTSGLPLIIFDAHMWEAYEPPIGVSCIGRRSRKELPKIPEIFSMQEELLFNFGNTSRVSFLATSYNYPGKLTSFFFRRPFSSHPRKIVHDFNYGLTYTIDEGSGLCNVSAVNTSGRLEWDFVISPDMTHVSLKNPTNFLIEPNATWTYEGQSKVRGLNVESWISEPFNAKWGGKVTAEIFFAPINYTSERFPPDITHFPVRKIYRTEIRNATIETRLEIYDFSHEVTGPWRFDTSQCFHEDEQRPLSFDLEGKDNFLRYVENNTVNFYHGVRESVMSGTGLPGSRITHIEVEEGSNEVLSIFVTLLGVPKIQGNAVNSSQNHSKPLEDAIEQLRTWIDLGTFTVNITVEGKMALLSVASGSLQEDFSDQAGSAGVSPGIAVMIAILTLVLGLVIGGLCMAYLQAKYSFKIPYLVQE